MSETDARNRKGIVPARAEAERSRPPRFRRALFAAALAAFAIAVVLGESRVSSGGPVGEVTLFSSPSGAPSASQGATATRAVPQARRTIAGGAAAPAPAETAAMPRTVPFRRGPGAAALDAAPSAQPAVPSAAGVVAPLLAAPVSDAWADFPCLGIDNDYVFVAANLFNAADAFAGTRVWAIRKSDLLAGNATLTWTEFTNPAGSGFTMQPAHTFGVAPAQYFVHEARFFGSTRFLRLSRITHPDNAVTWEDVGFVEVASYPLDDPPDAPQAGSALRIETNDTRLLNAVYRDGFLYTTHTVPNSGAARAEVAWYRIDPAAADLTQAGAPSQQGRVADPVRFYYYPSIAVNGAGDIALGFSGSDNTIFASAFYTGRTAADPPGTMRAVSLLKAGDGPYFKTFRGTDNRWGDYSATVVDPVDNTTFWTLQEYAGTPDNTWATWWGSFTIPPPPSTLLQAGPSFPGLVDPEVGGGDGVIPPDTMGAAGPSHLVSILNSEVGIFNKAGAGTAPIVSLRAFFAPLGTGPGQPVDGEPFDPRVLYDQYSDRFVAVAVSGDPPHQPSWLLLAMSTTSDPNDPWDFWAIQAGVPAVAKPPLLSGGGGGGGCATAGGGRPAGSATAATTLALLLAPAVVRAARRIARRGRRRAERPPPA